MGSELKNVQALTLSITGGMLYTDWRHTGST